jgi:autotransporter-associated beta strand protein
MKPTARKHSTLTHAFQLLIKALFLPALVFALTNQSTEAGSATWNASPTDSNWNTTSNWTPATVPNGPTDIATFDVSSVTHVNLRSSIVLDSMIFDEGASSYTINTGSQATLTLSGAGLVNNSGVTQTLFIPDIHGSQSIVFHNSATIGSNVAITNNGYGGTSGADIEFRDESSAGEGVFTNNNTIYWFNRASAGNATFINNPPRHAGMSPPTCYFSFVGRDGADNATFINMGATRSGDLGGATFLYSAGRFGHSTIINYGGTVSGAGGGFTECGGLAHVENMTFIAYGGTNGGSGGNIQMYGAQADNASVQIYDNSTLDISLVGDTTAIGSLDGEGTVFLGSNTLVIGSNRDSLFSGIIQNDGGIRDGDGGGVIKSGLGRLVFRRANLYDGGTVVAGGELMVNNKAGSGTGTGAVNVTAGTLTGRGRIAGPVIIGTGSGSGASLAPGRRPASVGLLTIQSALTFNSDGTYGYSINSSTGFADEVIANGVTISAGAQFAAIDGSTAMLASGTTFTVISNTAATTIAGGFVNLPDGSEITVGSNTYQADYEGGDGNDLTLTVVP